MSVAQTTTTGCRSCGPTRGLQFRTAGEYVDYAKRLERAGDPRARRAWQVAAIAVATARAADRGMMGVAARGLGALKGLGDPPPVLTRAQIDAKFRSLVTAEVGRITGGITAAAAAVSVLAGLILIFTNFIGDLGDRRKVQMVVGWINAVVQSAAGNPTAAPTISESDAQGIAGFCAVWGSISDGIVGGLNAAATGYAITDRAASTAALVGIRLVSNVLRGLCSDPQVMAAAAPPPPPPPPSGGGVPVMGPLCPDGRTYRMRPGSACGSGGHVRADGCGCEYASPGTGRPGTLPSDCGPSHLVCDPMTQVCDGTDCVPNPRAPGNACTMPDGSSGKYEYNGYDFVCAPSSGGALLPIAAGAGALLALKLFGWF